MRVFSDAAGRNAGYRAVTPGIVLISVTPLLQPSTLMSTCTRMFRAILLVIIKKKRNSLNFTNRIRKFNIVI